MNNVFVIFVSSKFLVNLENETTAEIMKEESLDIGDIVIFRAGTKDGEEWIPAGPIAVRRVVSISYDHAIPDELTLTLVRGYRSAFVPVTRFGKVLKFVRRAIRGSV